MKCNHCNSERTISRGKCIKCKDCGRSSAKIQRRSTIPTEERPLCPECRAPSPYSSKEREVQRWICKSCGRYYTNESNVNKVEIPNMEVQVE